MEHVETSIQLNYREYLEKLHTVMWIMIISFEIRTHEKHEFLTKIQLVIMYWPFYLACVWFGGDDLIVQTLKLLGVSLYIFELAYAFFNKS